jgi:ribonuclease HI
MIMDNANEHKEDNLKKQLLLHLWSFLVKGKKNITKINKQKITIHTDGGASGKKGAWAFVLQDEKEEITKSGKENPTTNNRMELKAVIESLYEVERRYEGREIPDITVNTDSQYVKNGITLWINKWRNNQWMTAQKTPVKNKQIWEELDRISLKLRPTYAWVKGHDGNEGNEKCDVMVKAEIKSMQLSS